jgi:carboxyl-terminal processing protease
MIVSISGFHTDTSELFAKAVDEALESHVDGMVIDLRNNPGGFMNAAIEVSCHWAANVPLVIQEERGEEPKFLACRGPDRLKDMPTVLLVNKGSASASEIMAGALQDHAKARLIGETTYGKGCGQSVIKYDDGSQLRLTSFLWKTPKGRSINKTGITPDETVAGDPKEIVKGHDAQLDRALQFLSNGK